MTELKVDVSNHMIGCSGVSLEKMLRKFGFHPTWVDRVMSSVTTVSYKFL